MITSCLFGPIKDPWEESVTKIIKGALIEPETPLEEEYSIKLGLLGVKKDEVSIRVNERDLIIETSKESFTQVKKVYSIPRAYKLAPEAIDVKLKNGLLEINIKKDPENTFIIWEATKTKESN